MGNTSEQQKESGGRERQSHLVFAFDDEGNPKIVASFASHKDMFALLGIARVAIDNFTSGVSSELVQPLLSGQGSF